MCCILVYYIEDLPDHQHKPEAHPNNKYNPQQPQSVAVGERHLLIVTSSVHLTSLFSTVSGGDLRRYPALTSVT